MLAAVFRFQQLIGQLRSGGAGRVIPQAFPNGGRCVYRTTPGSIGGGMSAWRGWNGTAWSVTVVDPYATPPPTPGGHLPAVVGPGIIGSGGVTFLASAGLFVAVGTHCTQEKGGPPVMHLVYSTSPDMTTWTPILPGGSVALPAPLTGDTIYPHLLDAASPSRNFDVLGSGGNVVLQIICGDQIPGPSRSQASRAGLFIPIAITAM